MKRLLLGFALSLFATAGCAYVDMVNELTKGKIVDNSSPQVDMALVRALDSVSKDDCNKIVKIAGGAAEFARNADIPNTGKLISLFKDVKTLYKFKDETASALNDIVEARLKIIVYENGKDGRLKPFKDSRAEIVLLYEQVRDAAIVAEQAK